MKTTFAALLISSSFLLPHCQSSAAPSGDAAELVERYWRADGATEQAAATEALAAATDDVGALYGWLKAGPTFSADVPTGLIEMSRSSEDGTSFPFVILVPEDYNAKRAYPVEFNLHGGVNRPKIQPGETAWRNGYESLADANKIVVLPIAWDDAFWWLDNQADNLPAILRLIKQRYNVDDNRVYMTGVSDGGTGSYFFAFMQPTEWAAFLPYIGHPGVLRNPRGRVSYPLSFDNLKGKRLFIVNGENDRLYPASAVQPYIDLMSEAGADFEFTIIPNGGHNTEWMPEQRPRIEKFKRDNVRDPLPDTVHWVTGRTDRYNRNHWLRIDKLRSEGQPGRIEVSREGNHFEVTNFYVDGFTLLLSPAEVDFSKPITVTLNGTPVFAEIVPQSATTLLNWANKDRDRSMLFTAELSLSAPPK